MIPMRKIADTAALLKVAWDTGLPKTFTHRGALAVLPYVLRRSVGPHIIFSAHEANLPDKLCIIDGGRSWTYGEFSLDVRRAANAFLDMGIKPGDKVAVMIDNCAEYQIVVGAAAYMGASLVPVSTHLKERELGYILEHSDSRSVACTENHYPTVKKALTKLPSIDPARCVVIGEGNYGPMRRLGDLLASGSDKHIYVNRDKIDSNIMMYTSGTTGRPKGASRNLKEVDSVVFLSIMEAFDFRHSDVHYSPCPLYHAAPTAYSTIILALGGTLVIGRRFDPHEFLKLVERHRITTVQLVPTLFNRLTRLTKEEVARHDLSSLRALISAAAYFPPTLKRRIMELFGDHLLYEMYGATEMGMTTTAKPKDNARHPDSIGKAMRGVEIKLLGEDGREVAVGEPGEIYVKTSYLIDGYYKNDEATGKSLREGYFTVGDVAKRDAEGYFYILDRKSDMVVSGGVNVYPVEVEEELMQHPAVYEAAVVGAPDEEWGEALIAFVVLRKGKKATGPEIIAWLGERLARYKKPKAIHFVDELPHNPQGKVLKRELRERLAGAP